MMTHMENIGELSINWYHEMGLDDSHTHMIRGAEEQNLRYFHRARWAARISRTSQWLSSQYSLVSDTTCQYLHLQS